MYLFKLIKYMYVSVRVYLHHVHVGAQKPEESVGSTKPELQVDARRTWWQFQEQNQVIY